jgi:lipopolysaccharide/colanic/teichoic acid biosynthesis glycosyltransferase
VRVGPRVAVAVGSEETDMERQDPTLEIPEGNPTLKARIEGISIQAPLQPPTSIHGQTYDFGSTHLQLSSDLRRMLDRDTGRYPVQRFFKRFMDVVLSAAGLFLLGPFVLVLSVLIKFDSRGPIMFSQTRVGRGGRLFRLHKFRTMIPQAEALKQDLLKLNEVDGPVFKMKNDPRVTRLGRFLRRTSLDELPQLWNVLIGDMSLVGPRPALPSEVAQWQPWQARRLSVEQGCTCIWQVSGRNHVRFEDWMRMDLEYVDRWSLLMDLKLIMLTVWVMLTGRGAY